MRKKQPLVILLLFISVLFSVKINAQQAERGFFRKHMQFQVGLNATDFAKQFIVFNSTNLTSNTPYLLNAKILYGRDVGSSFLYGIRAGVGYNDVRTATKSTSSSTERVTESTTLNTRFGLEIQQNLTKRLVIYYGVDYIWGKSSSETVNNTSGTFGSYFKTTSETKTTGAGPVLGIQFNINNHLTIGTEMSWYYQITKGGDKSENNFSGSGSNLTITENSINNRSASISVPSFINVNFIF